MTGPVWPDLYYTVFGLNGLAVLKADLPEPRDIRPFRDPAATATVAVPTPFSVYRLQNTALPYSCK